MTQEDSQNSKSETEKDVYENPSRINVEYFPKEIDLDEDEIHLTSDLQDIANEYIKMMEDNYLDENNLDVYFGGEIAVDDDLIPEEIQDIVPSYMMYRNNRTDIPTHEFMPGDLITLVIENTGSHKRTEVRMEDSKDQPRYHAVSGGTHHSHTTRIQRTTMFGDWKFIAKIPYDEDESFIEMIIPFKIAEHVPEPPPIELEYPEIIYPVYPEDLETVIIEEPTIIEQEIEPIAEVPEEPVSVEEPAVISEIAEIIPEFEPAYNFAVSNNVNIPVNDIKGVGPAFERKMALQKLFFMHDLLRFNSEELAEKLSTQVHRTQKWLDFIVEVLSDPSNSLVEKYKPKEIKEEIVVETAQPKKGKKPTGAKPSSISGIGPATEKKFIAAGFPDVNSIAEASVDQLIEKVGISKARAEKWHQLAVEAHTLVQIPTEETTGSTAKNPKENDPPSAVKGCGPATEKKLQGIGIQTVKQIVDAGIEPLTDLIGLTKASKLLENAKVYLIS